MLSGADLSDCADVFDAAAEVVDFQLRGGILMEVTAVCTDGAALRTLASGLRALVDAITDSCVTRQACSEAPPIRDAGGRAPHAQPR